MAVGGHGIATQNNMENSNKTTKKQRLKRIVDLLKFASTTDDNELIKSIIESVVEMLEEEIN